ncbi:hypothetical protein [Kitasatospora sp. NPDC002040]|uniref:hypothetical protein n=1 Tax=Kitasatospora sp. NPDC002040 TaxID=3154661 RepID=UPI0033243F8C
MSQGPGGWSAPVILIGTVLAMWVGIYWMSRNDVPVAAWALFVLNAAWLALVLLRGGMQEQQTLHDRGVTAPAVVTRWISTSDPMGGVDHRVTAVEVELPSGAGVARLELKGAAAPEVGTSVQVTRDPGGRVPIRLGPRPAEPGSALATIALTVVLGSSLVGSVTAAKALGPDL